MIRQSQTYFAAAVSVAALNAAAVGAFVLFMMLSSIHGWPLRSLLGTPDPVKTAPAASSAAPTASKGLRDGLFGLHRGTGSRSADQAAAGAGPEAATHTSGRSGTDPTAGGIKGNSDSDGSSGGPSGSTPGGTPSGAPGPSGSGGSGGGPTGGAPDSPALPASPSAIGPTVQHVGGTVQHTGSTVQQVGGSVTKQVGGSVTKLPPAVNKGVQSTVDTADGALGGSLSNSGASKTVKSASDALLG